MVMGGVQEQQGLTAVEPRAVDGAQPSTPAPVTETRSLLLEQIRRSRRQAAQQTDTLRRNYNWLTYGGVACSALATLIAGLAAVTGPLFGEGTAAWQATCGVVALFTAGAGALGGVQQGSQVADRLSRSAGLVARLNALEVALTIGGRETGDVAREYETLVADYEALTL
jgi:hypothetical protein